MKTVIVKMNERELRRYNSFKEAEKIARAIKRGLRDIELSNVGKKSLKSAQQLADEI
ncbi:MAG: hypothetical protein WCG93_11380 [Paludibacter sp.]